LVVDVRAVNPGLPVDEFTHWFFRECEETRTCGAAIEDTKVPGEKKKYWGRLYLYLESVEQEMQTPSVLDVA
jgi:hypothetical protein